MSHIPAAAMPHAKAHKEGSSAPTERRPTVGRAPWLALIVGGAVIAGAGALVTARLTAKPPRPVRRRSTSRRRRTKAAS